MKKLIGALIVLPAILLGCAPTSERVEVEVTRPVAVEVPIVQTQPVPVTVEVPFEVTREVTREVPVTVDASLLGTAERPFRLVFLPTVDARVIDVRGGMLIEALEEATGYAFEIVIPTDDGPTAVDEVCTRPLDTMAMLTAEQYLEAEARCGVALSHAALNFGVPYRLGMMVSREDRVINVIDDMPYKTIAVPDFDEWTTYEWFAQEAAQRDFPGVTFEEYGTDSAALLAVLNGEVDIATAVYNPPILPYDDRTWQYGVDRAEVWRGTGAPPQRDPIGYVDVLGGPEFGGYRVRDGRAAIFDDYPEIFDETRIIALSEPIPNPAVVLGRAFSLSAAQEIMPAMAEFVNSDACAQSLCASDFYQWDGMEPIMDDAYDPLRRLLENKEEE